MSAIMKKNCQLEREQVQCAQIGPAKKKKKKKKKRATYQIEPRFTIISDIERICDIKTSLLVFKKKEALVRSFR